MANVRKGGSLMAGVSARSFDTPDEVRQFAGHGQAELVNVGGISVGRGTFEPGWRWSVDLKPIVQTDLCQATHAGYIVSGRMAVQMADGTEGEAGPGDVVTIEPGHDAWVVGDEPCVFVDFGP